MSVWLTSLCAAPSLRRPSSSSSTTPTTRSTARVRCAGIIQHTVETLIAKEVISGDYVPGDELEVVVAEDALAVRRVTPGEA